MHPSIKPLLVAAAVVVAAQASAQVTFYANEGFRGPAYAAGRQVNDFSRIGFNDRASSAIVDRGRWEVCEDSNFRGRCAVLSRGSYDSLKSLGLENRISSVRPANRPTYDNAVPPPAQPVPVYEYRQRPAERLFQARVTDVRAVVGPPEQRCWVERQQVASAQPQVSVPGAVIGGVLGGILGHQIGGGTGRTVATIGGAVGGGALGANINRIQGDNGTVTRDVRRCQNVASTAPPQYWDVDYDFRGVQHHAQMAQAPAESITVNGRGEPRQ